MSKKENLDRDIDLKNYDDPSGVSLREMNFGLWLSEHRKIFLKSITIFLIILCAFFFIYSSYNLVVYFLSGDPNAGSDTSAVPTSPRQLTADLQISPLAVFSGDESSDLAVKLQNPNSKFMGSFKYCFTLAGNNLSCGNGFIMPGEDKYILALGQNLPGSQSEAEFKLTDIFWRRIDAHQIPDWNSFASDHLNFPVSAINFSSGSSNNLSEKISLNNLSFSIQNQTPYSYYEVPVNILLFNGEELVGVNRYVLENFLAGERRDIKISWPGSLSAVNRTEIKPDLDILDDQIYLKYQGTPATD